jgi:ABC-2 type transport system ATP-binding protein
LLQSAAGQVWEWVIPSADLPAARQRFLISGAVRTAAGVRLRAVADTAPAPDAQAVPPALEDAYLRLLARHRNGRTP